MRKFVFAGAALVALAGCATAPAPIYGSGYARPSAAPPLGPTIYTTAPRASVNGELFACSFNGANIGDLGPRRESILYTPYIATPAGPLLRDPTQSACLSSGFGWRGSDTGGGREHTGLDLASADGGWIFAAADGRVVANGWRNGYGLVLELDHGHDVHTMYAHLNEIDPRLAVGERVFSGQAIARMGNTGNATGVHLHYEVIVDGLHVDPLRYGAPAPAAPTWVSHEPPPQSPPAEVDTVTQTFAPPAPIEKQPAVEEPPPPPADPYARAPYDAYRAQTRSPYDIYNQLPANR